MSHGVTPACRARSPRGRIGVGLAVVVSMMIATVAAGAPGVTAADETEASHEPLESFVVQFDEGTDLTGAYTIDDPIERTAEVVKRLRRTAEQAQESVIARLRSKGYEYTSLWISNSLWMRVPRSIADAMVGVPGVSHVLVEAETSAPAEPVTEVAAPGMGPLWNIAETGAPGAWAAGIDGADVVVASLDSGVEVTHDALSSQWRAEQGWFDATRTCIKPCDRSGHGTHTTATMVGGGPGMPGTGVAPGAQFIVARVCHGSCELAKVMLGMQWLIAPTDDNGDPDPSARPDVINASWSREKLDESMTQALAALDAAGIEVVFAVGNNGPACGSNSVPGEMLSAFAVGSVDRSGHISMMSGRGPTSHGGTNPQITAPGEGIVSARAGGGYSMLSGTSMAAPHVSGALALVLGAHPHLRGSGLALGILERSARPVPDETCGPSPATVPNNVYGAGVLDIAAALALADEIDR